MSSKISSVSVSPASSDLHTSSTEMCFESRRGETKTPPQCHAKKTVPKAPRKPKQVKIEVAEDKEIEPLSEACIEAFDEYHKECARIESQKKQLLPIIRKRRLAVFKAVQKEFTQSLENAMDESCSDLYDELVKALEKLAKSNSSKAKRTKK